MGVGGVERLWEAEEDEEWGRDLPTTLNDQEEDEYCQEVVRGHTTRRRGRFGLWNFM